MTTQDGFEGWAIVELMGHRRLAGKVSPSVIGGAAVLRIDVPRGDQFTTQFYSGASLYALTPTTEEIARKLAAHLQPEPVSLYELRALPPQVDLTEEGAGSAVPHDDVDDEYEEEGDDPNPEDPGGILRSRDDRIF